MNEQTNEQLEARKQDIHSTIKLLKKEKRAIDAELQRRSITESAARKVAQMSPEERAAAAQMIGRAGGIASHAAVGKPGA